MTLTPQQWASLLNDKLSHSNQRLLIDCVGDLSWCLPMAQMIAGNQTARVLSDQDILWSFKIPIMRLQCVS